jgi:polyphenol oxidase
MFRKPTIFQNFSTLVAVESTRHGGVSLAPYSSLNLGKATADNMEAVATNFQLFYEGLGINSQQVARSHQIHEDNILIATQHGNYEGYDALITNQPNLFVGVSVADCTPILLYDAGTDAVAAIHAGWRGTVKEIVKKTLLLMQDTYQTRPQDVFGYVGTCIDEYSFEVGEEVAVNFDSFFKRYDAQRQKWYVDLKKANCQQLFDVGVPIHQIEVSPYCTIEHNTDYFSHRKEKGLTGRMMAIIGRKSCY